MHKHKFHLFFRLNNDSMQFPTIMVGAMLLLFFALPVSSQNRHLDTIPWNSIYFKSGLDGIIENRAEKSYTLRINEIMASNSEGFSDEFGEQDDWFEIYNYGDENVILNGLYFTDSQNNFLKWQFDTTSIVTLEPGEFKLFWADGTQEQGAYHTNFKLSADGEYVGIYTEDGNLIDGIRFEEQTTDVSFGRFPDGGETFYFNTNATPQEANSDSAFLGVLPIPEANQLGGLFNAPQTIKIRTYIPQAEVRFTVDCDEPSLNSPLIPDSLAISETTIIRAKTFKSGYAASPTLTLSLIFEKDNFSNPVISLVSDEENLTGNGGLFKSISQDIEIPAHLEMFVNNQHVYHSGTGIQLHSPKSTTKQYSMRLYARKTYGNAWFQHTFFDDNGPSQFKRLILRNAGNDNVQTGEMKVHFRDQIIQRVAKKSNTRPMISESKPVNVFINGEFYGIYNLRERIDEYYIETHKDVKDGYDLLERAFGFSSNQNAMEGSFQKYSDQVRFLDNAPDKNQTSTFDSVQAMFDLENFRDYWITEVYFGNYDWLSNNVKFWCPEGGKWQWIFWDLDHGLGLPYQSYGNSDWNTLAWSLGFADRAWSSGYNNRVARNLLENDNYKTNIIQRFTYFINTHFSYPRINMQIDSVVNRYRADLPRHLERWDNAELDSWENSILEIKNYVRARPEFTFLHLQQQFELANPVNVNITVEPAYAGEVMFSTGKITNHTFEGKFFPEMEYEISAKAMDGFEFVGWKNIESSNKEAKIHLKSDTSFTAIFQPIRAPEPLVINEVFYNVKNMLKASAWIELKNTTNSPIDISGYQLHVNKQHFTVTGNTIVKANEMLIIVSDLNAFQNVFKKVSNMYEIPSLNIPEKYSIKLTDNVGGAVDSIFNQNLSHIDYLSRNNGFSLELKSVYLDNLNSNNWDLSANPYGSPGLSNEEHYSFSVPQSTDFQIPFYNNQRFVLVDALQFPYKDEDTHAFVGISFQNSSQLRKLSVNGESIKPDSVYKIEHFPLRWEGSNDSTTYNFSVVDASGMKSSPKTMEFTKVVGVDNEKLLRLNISPIPANDFVSIQNLPDNGQKWEISIWSMSGKLLKKYSKQAFNSSISLPVVNLVNGVYVLRISGAKYDQSVNLIIQR